MKIVRAAVSMLLVAVALASCVIYEEPPPVYYGHRDGWHREWR